LRKNPPQRFVIPREGLPEESAFFFGFAEKQIPRFARDDNESYFFRSLFSLRVLMGAASPFLQRKPAG
jgi:hypothetical protein